MSRLLLLILTVLLVGCSQEPTQIATKSQPIAARDNGQSLDRPLIYRANVPITWTRNDPSPTESILDSTKHNCEFWIDDPQGNIRITIHTFPVNASHPRIPPNAQIHRWKDQFEELDPLSVNVVALAQGGFVGLQLEAKGLMHGKETKVLGWSMQLPWEYERQLTDEYKRADFTIKVVGNPRAVDNHKPEIRQFVKSFELIDELPNPL